VGQTDWQVLCDGFAKEDNLPTREVGTWSEDKLYFWHRYIQITSTAMVGKPAWPGGVVYVDLFAGPGICTVKGSGKRLPGSPLIAAHAAKPLTRIVACELDPTLAAACRIRLSESPAKDRALVLDGDCNSQLREIVRQIPRGALTLAFIDPESLHIRFDTVAKLAAVGAVDLLVLFADAFDVVRNVDEYYVKNPASRLDQFLGLDSGWRQDWASLHDRTAAKTRDLFLGVYQRQLRTLGYDHFGEQRIEGPAGPLYRLVYASKNSRGLDFWNKAQSKERDGQGRFF
jgi:three-Cys-motif partner protein